MWKLYTKGKVPESNTPEPPPVIEERTAPPPLPIADSSVTEPHDNSPRMSSGVTTIAHYAIVAIIIIGINMPSIISSTDIVSDMVLPWTLCIAVILMLKEARQSRYSNSCPRADNRRYALYVAVTYIYASMVTWVASPLMLKGGNGVVLAAALFVLYTGVMTIALMHIYGETIDDLLPF